MSLKSEVSDPAAVQYSVEFLRKKKNFYLVLMRISYSKKIISTPLLSMKLLSIFHRFCYCYLIFYTQNLTFYSSMVQIHAAIQCFQTHIQTGFLPWGFLAIELQRKERHSTALSLLRLFISSVINVAELANCPHIQSNHPSR